MRSLLILLFCCNLLLSCDDGDVLNVQLDFDKNLTLCEPPASSNFILYDTKNDPNESLTLLFPNNAQAQSILYPTVSGNMETMTINNSTVKFIYRTYTGDPTLYICQDIPDENVSVNENYEANSGTVNFISTFEDDDSNPNATVRTIRVNVTLENIDLTILAAQSFPLGTHESVMNL